MAPPKDLGQGTHPPAQRTSLRLQTAANMRQSGQAPGQAQAQQPAQAPAQPQATQAQQSAQAPTSLTDARRELEARRRALQVRAADGSGPSGYGSHPELWSHSLTPRGDPVMDALMAWDRSLASP